MRNSRLVVAVLFLVISGLLIWRNFQMSSVPLADWDESIYARIGVELVKSPSLQTSYNGSVWLEKPPLINYLLAIVHAMSNGSVFWLRMISVTFAVAVLCITYIFTARHLVPGRRDLPDTDRELLRFLPVFFLLSTPLFVERSTLINYDLPLALGWILYFTATSFRWKLVALLTGVTSKSLLGFFPVLFDIFRLKRIDYSWKTFRQYSLLAVLPLSWHIIALVVYGNTFLQQHVIDHMIRRVVDPIELHFGGRLFYIKELWNEYGLLSIILSVCYLYLAFVVFRYLRRRQLPPYVLVVVAAPLVFLTFLTFSATKIWWYVLPALPLMGLVLPFALAAVPIRRVRLGMAGILSGFLLFRFLQQTAFFVPTIEPSAKHALAYCVAELPGERIAFLVDEDERKIKQVFEAAQIGISSSFVYGGSPAFVYYAGKQVAFYYDTAAFQSGYASYPIAVLASGDTALLTDPAGGIDPECRSGDWMAITSHEVGL